MFPVSATGYELAELKIKPDDISIPADISQPEAARMLHVWGKLHPAKAGMDMYCSGAGTLKGEGLRVLAAGGVQITGDPMGIANVMGWPHMGGVTLSVVTKGDITANVKAVYRALHGQQ